MYTTSSGQFNVAVGVQVLYSNTTASNNTAIGYQALYANTAADNTAVGYQSLLASTGIRNTAVGSGALVANTTGTLNVAVGYQAVPANTVGSQNVGIGYQALLNSNGTGNTNNIAIGVQAGVNITTGTNNLTIGTSNAGTLSTGSGNIGIGGFNSSGSSAPVYAFAGGDNNRVQIGSTAVTNAYIQVAWTVVSDARDKTDFQPIPHGLSFVQQLNPVSFYFKESRDSDVKTGIKRYGFKAQEILALEGDDAVIIDNEDSEKLRYNGEALVPVLVKAIQELSAANEALTARIAALEAK
jgi:hypothetical protein